MMATWLTCLSAVSVATAAPVWYLGAAFGMLWRGLGPAELNVWMAVGGIILVILGLYGAGGSRQERPGLTFGDILRDE
jgi:hypothetical protein